MGLFKSRRSKILTKIRASWAHAKEKRRNFDRISRYAAIHTDPGFHRLTTQTLSDIDIEELFACIDRTETGLGQQFLFNKLLHPTNNIEALKETDELARYFLSARQAREAVQYRLNLLEENGTYFIVDLFDLAKKAGNTSGIYPFLSLAAVMLTVLTFFIPVLFTVLVFLYFLNILLHFIHRNRSQQRLPPCVV